MTNRTINRALRLLVLCTTAAVASLVHAHNHEPPAVAELYACSYKDGKDMGDLMSARDYLLKQADKAEIKLGPSFLWTLIKGGVGFDLLWLDAHESFDAFAKQYDAAAGSEAMASVPARFNTVVDCSAGLATIATVHEREDYTPDPNGSAIVSALACNWKPNAGMSASGDLLSHIAGTVGGLGKDAPGAMYAMTPRTAGPNTPDIVLFTVNQSMSSYAKFNAALRSSDQGPALGRHLDQVADCNLAIWNGRQVIAGPEE